MLPATWASALVTCNTDSGGILAPRHKSFSATAVSTMPTACSALRAPATPRRPSPMTVASPISATSPATTASDMARAHPKQCAGQDVEAWRRFLTPTASLAAGAGAVILPEAVVVAAEAVEIDPAVEAGRMAVVEDDADGVI